MILSQTHISISKSWFRFQPLAPITEDKEGEEIAELLLTAPPAPTSLESRRSSVAPIVIRNRIQQRLTRKDLYFKAIQELLEIGDAYRVSRELSNMIRESDDEEYEIISEDEEEEDCFPFLARLKQRKMSLAGILEQSAAERAGFAALLAHKLHLLLMEDEIECEASVVPTNRPRRSSSESAPAWLASGEGEGGERGERDEESLTIFNESDLTSRGIVELGRDSIRETWVINGLVHSFTVTTVNPSRTFMAQMSRPEKVRGEKIIPAH